MRVDASHAYGVVVTQRRWTLRGGDSEIAVLVITSDAERLDALALEVSSHGYYTFVATPEAVAALVSVTKFDAAVILADVTPEHRASLAQIDPPINAKLVTLDANDDWTIVDRIRARLAH